MARKQAKFIAYNRAMDDGARWIENASDGLRIVGTCHDIARGEGWRMDHDGWHLDPWGDGETVCGAVLQLPARDGVAQYVPAMQDPWNSDCYRADFSSVTDDKRDALRWADAMAERYAEHERDYQTEEAARMRCEEAREEICAARATVTRLARDLRTAGHALPPSTRETVRLRIRALRDAVREARETIERLTDSPWLVLG